MTNLYFGLSSVLLLSAASFAAEQKVCIKDGRKLELVSEKAKEKEAECKKAGGTWQKKPKGKKEAGGGGGW